MTVVNDNFVANQSAFFIERNDLVNRWGNVVSTYLLLPGLIGFWPMSSVQRNTGNVYDIGGQGRSLTYNGNPTFNYYNGLVPYIDLDGTGDYLSRGDETGLDVIGTESWAANPGLTMGCWVRVAGYPGGSVGLISKDDLATNRSYLLFMNSSGQPQSQVSNDGSTMISSGEAAAVTVDTWFLSILRWIPSTEISIFVNNVETVGVTSVPASLFNGTAPFNVGAIDGTASLAGDLALPFLSANALSDALISLIFEQTRTLFGV